MAIKKLAAKAAAVPRFPALKRKTPTTKLGNKNVFRQRCVCVFLLAVTCAFGKM